MNSRNAKILIISIIILIIAALVIFYLFFRKSGIPYTPVNPENNGTLPISTSTNNNGEGGTGANETNPGQTSHGQMYENHPQQFAQKLRLISSLPVSGATLFTKNAETFIRYVERANGHIFEAKTSDQNPPNRISNTTIPKIYEAYWVRDGQAVILRYLKEDSDEIQTFYMALKQSSTSSEAELVDGTFLQTGITTLSVSPGEDKIFYLLDSGDSTYGIRANANGTQKTQLFDSPAHQWLTDWPSGRIISLATKPSAQVPGFLYYLDANTGNMTRTLGDVAGLTALPNSDGSQVLFSQTTSSGFALKLLDTKLQKITDLEVTTLPEKCIWGTVQKNFLYCAVPTSIPAGDYPDLWYQGLVSFTDDIIRIDTTTGQTKIMLTPQSAAKQTMDIENLVLDAKENYLLFSNKKDLSLWLLDLK